MNGFETVCTTRELPLCFDLLSRRGVGSKARRIEHLRRAAHRWDVIGLTKPSL